MRAPPGWLLLAALCVTQTTTWGTLYYALPVTSGQIAADTGWSVLTITSMFSVGLIFSAASGIPAGRLLDRYGARSVIAVSAGSYPTALLILAGVCALGTIAASLSRPRS